MAERERYNPYTGEYELAYDDGIYETNPYGPGEAAPPPAAEPAAPPPAVTPPAQTGPTTTPPPNGSTTPNMDPEGYTGGYWMNGAWVRGEPRSAPGGPLPNPGTDGTGGALAQFDSSGYEWPTYTAPAFQGAGVFKPRQDTFAPSRPTFDYDPFAPPTAEQARNNPGYQAAATEARKQLEAGAAYRGTLRSGMTLGDILKQQTALGDQNYNQVFGRELDTYKTNRGNAYENWMGNLNSEKMAFDTNYGIDRDIFDRSADDTYRGNDYRFNASQAEFAPQQRKSELTFADLYSRWRDLLNSTTQIATAGD